MAGFMVGQFPPDYTLALSRMDDGASGDYPDISRIRCERPVPETVDSSNLVEQGEANWGDFCQNINAQGYSSTLLADAACVSGFMHTILAR